MRKKRPTRFLATGSPKRLAASRASALSPSSMPRLKPRSITSIAFTGAG